MELREKSICPSQAESLVLKYRLIQLKLIETD